MPCGLIGAKEWEGMGSGGWELALTSPGLLDRGCERLSVTDEKLSVITTLPSTSPMLITSCGDGADFFAGHGGAGMASPGLFRFGSGSWTGVAGPLPVALPSSSSDETWEGFGRQVEF